MPSGAQLIDRTCRATGMDITASSTDRALILTFVQEAVDRVAFDGEVVNDPTQSVSLTSGTAKYDLTSSPFNISGLISINEITMTDSSVTAVPLEQKTMADVLYLQQGAQANASPYCYAVDYPTIVVYPTPGSGTTLNVSFTADGPTISDNSTQLTFIPKALQWGCISELSCALALRHKKNPAWQTHMDAYLNDRHSGLPALRRWRQRVGGVQRPSPSGTSGFVPTSPSQDLGW
jgi:hypothetical protein